MDLFEKFKKEKKEKENQNKRTDKIGIGSEIKVIKGPYKGLIGTVRHIKEEKWVYITTCMNEMTWAKLLMKDVIKM